jgi:hypothetical protein
MESMSVKAWTLIGIVIVVVAAALFVFRPATETTTPGYTIEETGGVLEVTIRGYDGPLEPVLGAFEACRTGNCSCPTDEYENLESLDVQTEDNTIVLTLTPKQGATLDQTEIRACLDFTLDQAAGESARSS